MVNQLINVLWTLASFMVVGDYWGGYFLETRSLWLLSVFLILSIVAYSVPARWLAALTLSTDRRTYERIGIGIVLWLVQNGKLVSRIERLLGTRTRKSVHVGKLKAHLRSAAMAERFHYSCFVFFTLSTASAISAGKLNAAFFMILWNIIYNVYPILLQQYIRLRINVIATRRASHREVGE